MPASIPFGKSLCDALSGSGRPQTAHMAQDTHRHRQGNAGVRAVEVTGSNIGEAAMPPELQNQTPNDQDIGSVTADGAYDTRKCHEAIAPETPTR